MADPLADYLRAAKLSDEQRAVLWDLVTTSTTPDELATKLQPLPIPAPLKADLWDLKAGKPVAPPAQPGALERFTTAAGGMLNPLTMIEGFYESVKSPQAAAETGGRIFDAAADQFQKTKEAYRQGRYTEAAGHGLATAVPIMGPAAAQIGEEMVQTGDVATGLGKATGLVGSMFVPTALAKSGVKLPALPQMGKYVPAPLKAAVQFGFREGIPVDVGTATGDKFLQAAQKWSSESLLGGPYVGAPAAEARSQALTATGARLAERVSPTQMGPLQAGGAIRNALTSLIERYRQSARAGYRWLEAIEAQQGLTVDLAPVKATVRPIYEALLRESELVPLVGDKARALTTLDRLLNQAPDVASLSVADGALSDLKSLTRVEDAFRRTAGQGAVVPALDALEQAVRRAAAHGGPDATQALMSGRAATVLKYKTIDLLDELAKDPATLFQKLTGAKGDVGLERLQELARVAPAEVRQLGRAWVEDLMTKATQSGEFSHAQKMLADWEKIGPTTKGVLFGPSVPDLNNFFILAKKLAELPNPSGSAMVGIKFAEAAALGGEMFRLDPGLATLYTGTAPLIAKLLLSPKTAQLLLQGLRVPLAPAAKAALVAQLARLAHEAPQGAQETK